MLTWLEANNAIITYALEEPTESEISVGYTPLIEVEGGGALEIVTDGGRVVPSTITFTTIAD